MTGYQHKTLTASDGGSLRVAFQKIMSRDNSLTSVFIKFETTGAGVANTTYNGGTIAAEAAPPGDMAFVVPVTTADWVLKGYGTIVIRPNGNITYQINYNFPKSVFLFLNATYETH